MSWAADHREYIKWIEEHGPCDGCCQSAPHCEKDCGEWDKWKALLKKHTTASGVMEPKEEI